MSLTRQWNGNKEDWGNGSKSATVIYTGPWSTRAADKNAILAAAHPDYSILKAATDSIEPLNDASDTGGPLTAKHTVAFNDPTSNPDDNNNQPQNNLSDWMEHWEAGGEAITIGMGYQWHTAPTDKITKSGVSAVKMFPTATISLTGTTSVFTSTQKTIMLNLVGKINANAVTIKGLLYDADHLLYLGTGADQLGTNAAGSDLYKLQYNYAYHHDNTWNELWREDLPGGPGFDQMNAIDDVAKHPYVSAEFSDMDPQYW